MTATGMATAALQQHAPSEGTVGATAELYFDQDCQLVVALGGAGIPARMGKDNPICRIEDLDSFVHVEDPVNSGERKRVWVALNEYIVKLHNPMEVPARIVVSQCVSDGWEPVSSPAPVEVHGNVAIYRADVKPGETADLRVGEILTSPEKISTAVLRRLRKCVPSS